MGLKFRFKSCTTLRFLRDSGSEFQTVGPKTEKDLFQKVSREKRGTVSSELRPRGTVWMKKVRNIRWHTVLTETLKTEINNFVLNPSIPWKPVECSEQS